MFLQHFMKISATVHELLLYYVMSYKINGVYFTTRKSHNSGLWI